MMMNGSSTVMMIGNVKRSSTSSSISSLSPPLHFQTIQQQGQQVIHQPIAIAPGQTTIIGGMAQPTMPIIGGTTTGGIVNNKVVKRKSIINHEDPSSPGKSVHSRKRWRMSEDEDHEEIEKRALANSKVTGDGRYLCGECGNSLANSWGLDAHIKTVHGKKTFQCDYCDKAFKRRDHLVNHTNSIHTGRKSCSLCNTMCKGKEGLMAHIRDFHPEEHAKNAEKAAHNSSTSGNSNHGTNSNSNGASSTAYMCTTCNKKFNSDASCKLHFKQFHSEVKCNDCHALCTGTEGLKSHVQAAHGGGGGNGTTQLRISQTSSGPSIIIHQNNGHAGKNGEVVYKCQFCSGAFIQKASLEQHIQSFHVEVECQQCGSQFIGHETMAQHVKEAHHPHTMLYNDFQVCFHCELCNITFSKRSQYDDHFLTYHVSRHHHNSNHHLRKPTTIATGAATTVLEQQQPQQQLQQVQQVVQQPSFENIFQVAAAAQQQQQHQQQHHRPVIVTTNTGALDGIFTHGVVPATAAITIVSGGNIVTTTAANNGHHGLTLAKSEPTPTTTAFYSDINSDSHVSEAISQIFMTSNGHDVTISSAAASPNSASNIIKKQSSLRPQNGVVGGLEVDDDSSSHHHEKIIVDEEPSYQLLQLGEELTGSA